MEVGSENQEAKYVIVSLRNDREHKPQQHGCLMKTCMVITPPIGTLKRREKISQGPSLDKELQAANDYRETEN